MVSPQFYLLCQNNTIWRRRKLWMRSSPEPFSAAGPGVVRLGLKVDGNAGLLALAGCPVRVEQEPVENAVSGQITRIAAVRCRGCASR